MNALKTRFGSGKPRAGLIDNDHSKGSSYVTAIIGT